MKIHEYDRIVCLCVDQRYAIEWPRVRQLIHEKKGEARCFVEGKGELLPRDCYHQISSTPPAGWRGHPNAYNHFTAMQSIVREARESGVRTLLFLEDDVDFTDRFDEIVECACVDFAEFGIQWDMLYYGANHTWAETREIGPNLLRICGSLTLHCVGIRSTAFDAILTLPPHAALDLLISTQIQPVYECYSVWPSVALQMPGFSQINNANVDYTAMFRSKGRNHPSSG
jgi:hypothetical protein